MSQSKLHFDAKDEATIQGDTVMYARGRGCLAYKFRSTGQNGVPDYLFIYRGQTFYIEFKAFGKKPEPLQEHHMTKISDSGGLVSWADNLKDGIAIVEQFIATIDDMVDGYESFLRF